MKWERFPEQDRRIAKGDDWAGDAWRNTETGEVKWCVVGHTPSFANVEKADTAKD